MIRVSWAGILIFGLLSFADGKEAVFFQKIIFLYIKKMKMNFLFWIIYSLRVLQSSPDGKSGYSE